MKHRKSLLILFMILALSACTQPTVAPAPLPTTAVPPSLTATITPALPPPIETATPSPSATETPILAPTLTPTSIPPAPLGWLAFVDFLSGSPNISIARTDGRGARTIVRFFAESPSWSPDGQWIAMDGTYDSYNGGWELYLAHADGSSFALLLSRDGSVVSPSWSPDGRFIVHKQMSYWGSDQDDFVDLFVIEVSTGLVQRLTNTPGISEHYPVYSPDGSKIAFVAGGLYVPYNLMVMDANGENVTQLTHSPFDNFSPSWSPDGQRIAFASDDGCGVISIINADGSGLQQLPRGPGYARYPAWSPDGEWIVFTNSPCKDLGNNNATWSLSGSRLYAIRTDGSGLQVLPILETVMQPAWSPLPALQVEGRYAITELGEGLNLRASPALDGEVVEKLHEGDEILVLEGPVEASQYLWWRVRLGGSDLEGWVAENPGWFMYPGD